MKKDFTRDYTTEAFRMYAAMGKPTYDEARAAIYIAELSKRRLMPPDIAITQAQSAVNKRESLLLDILAVGETIELLKKGDRKHIVSAIEEVYFVSPSSHLSRGDISQRVRRYALKCPTDERTVYRWLKEARLLCAAVRGLRITPPEEKQIAQMCQ